MASEIWLGPIIKSDIFIPTILGTVSVLSTVASAGKSPGLWQIVDIPTVACLDIAVFHDVEKTDSRENRKQLNNVKRSEINGPEECDPTSPLTCTPPECFSRATEVACVHPLGDVT